MSDLFNMERFRRDVSSRFCFELELIELSSCEALQTGTLFVEWSDVKVFDSSWLGKKDDIGW